MTMLRILLADRLELVLQPEVRVDLADELRLELGQRDARRRDRQVRHRRRHDDVGHLHGRLGDRVVDAALH